MVRSQVEKVVGYYREELPDWEVEAVVRSTLVNTGVIDTWDILFRKDNDTLNLERAIIELYLLSPNAVLNKIENNL